MVNLRVLIPEATENYITNPAFRYSTTGWTAVGATLTRSLDFARFNIASGKVVTNGAALGEGIYFRVNSLSGISDVITDSIYLRGGENGQKVRLRLQDDPFGSEWTSEVVELRADRWTRVEVSGQCTGGDDVRLKVETATENPVAYTFYVDGAQMERKAYSTFYCDGDQDGCRWNIVSHGSNSTRTADTRAGGKWVSLAGPCRPDNDIYVTVLDGLGVPPVANNIQPWSQSPGSFFQNQKILDRVITLTFTVKKENLRTAGAPSLRAIHDLRQQLVDLFKTDVTLDDEAFLFEYSDSDGDKPLYIRLRYEAGLEGNWDIRNGWFNIFAVRLIAVDPLWMQDAQEVQALTVKDTAVSAASSFWRRRNGQWMDIGNSAGTKVGIWGKKMAEGPDGTIYICGTFTVPVNRIAKWDGITITELGAGGADGRVNDIAVAPDGTVYATGTFTTIGGVAANGVAKYNPVTNTWSAMGAGIAGLPATAGNTLCVAPNGDVYLGGQFTTVGGVACNRIAKWNGAVWSIVGAGAGGGFNDVVHSIINAGDGNTLYVGGDFTSANGVTNTRLSSVDIDANTISPLGYGVNTIGTFGVAALTLGLDGTLYAGGDFNASGAPSAAPLVNMAKYSGGQIWEPVGCGLTGNLVYGLSTGKRGEIYAVGYFDSACDVVMYDAAKWMGNAWFPLEFPQRNHIQSISGILEAANGDLYISGNFTANETLPKINSINNPGSASVWPTMYITGLGTLRYICNVKTGKEIFLNLEILAGEEIFIDFARGKITGTVRGDLSYTIVPGSEIRTIYLLPGDNQLSIYVDNNSTCSMQIEFQPQDWSADAVIDAEAMV